MLHALPVRNVLLSPCSVAATQLTPVPGGQYCASCQRVVQDFTQATPAELAAARAAAPDGRVCGQFRASQLAAVAQPQPALRPRLQRFLLAAVLVLVQGLTAQQAWAQTCPTGRPPARNYPVAALYTLPEQFPWLPAEPTPPTPEPAQPASEPMLGGIVLEPMPEFPGGQEALLQFLRANIHYPQTTAEGKVFVQFLVRRDGQIAQPQVLKAAHPLLAAEALRVVRLMPRWQPARTPTAVLYMLPITFIRPVEPAAPASR